jgi:hypothetical protein
MSNELGAARMKRRRNFRQSLPKSNGWVLRGWDWERA